MAGVSVSWNAPLRWKQSVNETEAIKIFHRMRLSDNWHSSDTPYHWRHRSPTYCAEVSRLYLDMERSDLGLRETCRAVEARLERVLSSMPPGELNIRRLSLFFSRIPYLNIAFLY